MLQYCKSDPYQKITESHCKIKVFRASAKFTSFAEARFTVFLKQEATTQKATLYSSILFSAFRNWKVNRIAVKVTAITSAIGSAIYTPRVGSLTNCGTT